MTFAIWYGALCLIAGICAGLLAKRPTFPQSSSLAEQRAEAAHSGKQNTADKSELLPTQLPKEDSE
jgi:hypothetical protein